MTIESLVGHAAILEVHAPLFVGGL